MKKVFISVSSRERRLGEIIKDKLARLLENQLKFSLFDIPIGSEWKNELKRNLDTSDILISILTPFYLQRPWSYIEWTPFWLADKKTFLLVPSKTNKSDSHLDVFNDIQFAYFDDEVTLENLVKEIAHIVGVDYTDNYPLICEFKHQLSDEYNRITQEIKAVKYDYYKTDKTLPFSDIEKEEYALYFYEKKDDKSFIEIIKSVSSEEVKFEIARKVLDKSDINAFKQLVSLIYSNDRLLSLLIYIVYIKDNRDLNYREAVIEQMTTMGDSCLLQFLLYMIKNGIEKDGLFDIVVNKLEMDTSKQVVYNALWVNNEKYRAENIFPKIFGNADKVIILSRHAQKGEFEVFKNRVAMISSERELIRLIRHMRERINLNYDEYKNYYDAVINNMSDDIALRDLYVKFNYGFLYQVINDRRIKLGYQQL